MSNTLENSKNVRAEIDMTISLLNGLLAYCNESGYWLLPCDCMIIHRSEVERCEICGANYTSPYQIAEMSLTHLSALSEIQSLIESILKEKQAC